MRAPTISRRAALASAVLPVLASSIPATAAPSADARLLALAHSINAADAALEAACIRVSRAQGTPEEAALDDLVGPASYYLDALIRQAADIPAEGVLGISMKGNFVALAVENGASLVELDLADSLRRDVARLFPALVVAPVPTEDASALPVADAALLRLCDEHAVNLRAYNSNGGHLEAEDDPLWAAYTRTRDAIGEAQPQTIEGLLAKAHAATIEADLEGGECPESGPAASWAWDLVNDLLRLRAVVSREGKA